MNPETPNTIFQVSNKCAGKNAEGTGLPAAVPVQQLQRQVPLFMKSPQS